MIFQNLNILKADPKACKVFDEPPLVLFWRAKNIRDITVRTRVNIDSHLDSRACSRPRCKTCYISQSCEVKMPRDIFRMTRSLVATLKMR